MPAIFQVRNERDGQELFVDLCILHLKTISKAVEEMQGLRQEAEISHLLSEEARIDEQEA